MSGHEFQDGDFVADYVVTIGAIVIAGLAVALIVLLRCL
jgi:hypothetical protein